MRGCLWAECRASLRFEKRLNFSINPWKLPIFFRSFSNRSEALAKYDVVFFSYIERAHSGGYFDKKKLLLFLVPDPPQNPHQRSAGKRKKKNFRPFVYAGHTGGGGVPEFHYALDSICEPLFSRFWVLRFLSRKLFDNTKTDPIDLVLSKSLQDVKHSTLRNG